MSSCIIFQHALFRPLYHSLVGGFLCFSIDFPRSETLPHARAVKSELCRPLTRAADEAVGS
jgi:hypothetical protein